MAKRHTDDDSSNTQLPDGSTDKRLLLDRRTLLRLTGSTAFVAGAAAIGGSSTAQAAVDLGGAGLSDGDLIDPYLEEHFTDGSEVHIPAGTYRWEGGGFGSLSDAALIGDGEVVFETPNREFDPTLHATSGTVVVQNITDVTEISDGSCDTKFRVYADDDAEILMENVNRVGGQSDDSENTGYYVPPQHAGKLTFRDCTLIRCNNGIYASPPGKPEDGQQGQVIVEGGLYMNNNVAAVRIGSHNSIVRNVTIVNDDTIPNDCGGDNNGRGIRVREPGNDILIEDCDITYTADSDGASTPIIIQPDAAGGGGTIRNCRIWNERDNNPIDFAKEGSPDGWSGSGIHLTGPGNLDVDGEIDSWIACRADGCDIPTREKQWVGDGGDGSSGSSGGNTTTTTDSSGSSLEVSTLESTNVGETSATLQGSLDSLGDASEAEGYFEYREAGSSSWTATDPQTLSSTGAFSQEVSGLSADTDYDYRAVGQASDPTAGDTLTFTTGAGDANSRLFEIIADTYGELYEYEFVVDGSVQVTEGRSPAITSVNETNDAVSEQDDGTVLVSGQTGYLLDHPQGDAYVVTGEIQSYQQTGGESGAKLYLDGGEVTVEALNGGDSSGTDGSGGSDLPNRVVFEAKTNGSDGSYAFEVSGEVAPEPGTGSLEDSDVVSGSTVEGELDGSVDAYRYSGDIVAFELRGDATVRIEDNE